MLQDDLTVFTQQSAPQRCLISLVTYWIADLRACVYVKGPEYPVITRSARKIKPATADCLSHCPSAGNLGLRRPQRWKHSQLAEPSAASAAPSSRTSVHWLKKKREERPLTAGTFEEEVQVV